MRNILIAFLVSTFASLAANNDWPPSEHNQWEVVNFSPHGLFIPLPDFTFSESMGTFSVYSHITHPYRKLFVFVDEFDPRSETIDLFKYETWCTQGWKEDDESLKVVSTRFARSRNNVPLLRGHWKNSKGTLHTLRFVNKECGFSLISCCFPPDGMDEAVVAEENAFCEKLLNDLGEVIRFKKTN